MWSTFVVNGSPVSISHVSSYLIELKVLHYFSTSDTFSSDEWQPFPPSCAQVSHRFVKSGQSIECSDRLRTSSPRWNSSGVVIVILQELSKRNGRWRPVQTENLIPPQYHLSELRGRQGKLEGHCILTEQKPSRTVMRDVRFRG
jgi:hypothetical protein